MSWASDAVERLRQPHNNGSAWAVERAIRETIEECARRVREGEVIEAWTETYYAQLGDGRATLRAAADDILAMLKEEP